MSILNLTFTLIKFILSIQQWSKQMNFILTSDNQLKINEWLEKIHDQIMEASMPDPLGGDQPFYGAMGGGLTYSFTPTGLGVVLIVTESSTGEELNLTDFDSW